MILNILTLIFIIIKSTKCSIVNDAVNQELNYLSKHCPKQKYCREGTHVVCMYYRHNQEFGPRCRNPLNVDLTPTMINHILTNVNNIRGKVASGVERGKNGEFLPKAYGLMKLEWDRELAILAQVLANQCLGGKEDLCRATTRFPNPSQTIILIRNKYPNWEYMRSKSNNGTRKGLNEEKLKIAITKFIRNTYALKTLVTKEMIMSCPYFHKLPDANLKYYLNLIRGGATHIGCGVSAYFSNNMHTKPGSLMNHIEIVCNISEAPRPRQPVYKIIPPLPRRAYSNRCGCPRGYKETRSCLCEKFRTLRTAKVRSPLWPRRTFKNQLEEHIERESSRNIETYNDERNNEVMLPATAPLSPLRRSLKTIDGQSNAIESPRRVVLQSRNNKISKAHNKEEHRSEDVLAKSINYNRQLFKITKAITPKKNRKYSKITNERILPTRKSSRNPMISDMNVKQPLKPVKSVKSIGDLIFRVRKYVKEEATARSVLDDEKAVQTKKYNKNRDNSDKRLMLILNSLEQEVNNIIFDEDMKKLFFSKMRKIYETGLKKHGDTPEFKALNIPEETPSLNDLAEELNVYKKDLSELRNYLKDKKNNHASVDDDISKYGRIIQRSSKEIKTENKVTCVENENNQNQNNNYEDLDEHLKSFRGSPDSYIPNNTALTQQRDYNKVKYRNISNENPDIDYQHEDYNELQDNAETIDQTPFPQAYSDLRNSIFSKLIEYNSSDDYDDENGDLGLSNVHDESDNERNVINAECISGRSTDTFRDAEPQLNHSYDVMNQDEETPLKMDNLRPMIYSSEGEILI